MKKEINLIIISIIIIIGITNLKQAKDIADLKDQVKYLKQGYEDMDDSLDCVLAFGGKIELRQGRGCLLPNGIWKALN